MKLYMLTTKYIDLEIELEQRLATISAQFSNTPLSTKKMAGVIALLSDRLPSIFLNKCFNDDHRCFRQEAQATEIGHLFEHVLMEYMCIEHELLSAKPIKINGLTSWNWYQEPVGTFTIELKTDTIDESVFIRALNQTLALFEDLIGATATPAQEFAYLATEPPQPAPVIAKS